ncbi:MAG: biopolymer transporter ExbD [Gammaproteobacteria bacterium]|nr:biopolymer transporter ExbD [Gammaproteobacteria bacterium]MDH4310437.1 biopolymer transporter ExbD [Gammaproteobacteria bacterium]MDH5272819.1 biopolymer transporter ExbD [Gammaproteobacteria bacterium]
MKFQRKQREEVELNMTSLIDVVLLLLIFFMMSTKFIDEGRLQVRLPAAGVQPDEASVKKTVEIEVTAEGNYRVGGRDLVNNSPDTLATALARATSGNRAQPLTIRADARAVHQSVVTAMDVAGRLGYRQINIATVHDGSETR